MQAGIPYYSSEAFAFNRTQPPLFFTEGGPKELPNNNRIMREYFRLGSQPGVTHNTVLSNGMTMGELAMIIVRERNSKRQKMDGSAS